jgi:antitoxin FitA
MGDLLIRNVPEDLKRDLAEAARLAGRSLSDEAKRRLRQSAPQETALPRTGADLLQSMQAFLSDVSDGDRDEFAEIVDEIVEQRKRDAGAPSPFKE